MYLSKSEEFPPENYRHVQKVWDKPLIDVCFSQLQADLEDDVDSKARLLASSTSESGSWLNALPIRNLRNDLTNEEFRIAIALRLGANLCEEHQCICKENADKKGYHGLSCKRRGSKHDQICDIMCAAANTAGLQARREPCGLFVSSEKRPDGKTLVPFINEKLLAFDYTCPDTYAMTYIAQTSVKAGAAAEKPEEHKANTYKELLKDFVLVG